MLRIGVLASHEGTNFQAIAQACQAGELNAKIALLISNNARARVIARAKQFNVPALHLSSVTHRDPLLLDLAIRDALIQHDVELVVLAGYMKKLGSALIEKFKDRIINVHPSLLPKYGGAGYYGGAVHQAVIDAGDKQTGASVHLVDGEYDTGQVLQQEKITVQPNDNAETLADRLRPVEHQLLISVIDRFSKGNYS